MEPFRNHNIDLAPFCQVPDLYNTPYSPACLDLPTSYPKFVKMSYGPKSWVLFIARIERIVTATQNNDLTVSATMVRLSNAPPPIT